jgi:uncharacterized protein YciI
MKHLLFPSLFALTIYLGSCGNGSNEPKIVIDSVVEKHEGIDLLSKEKPEFDSTLAAAMNADEYGMHHYVMAFLKAGPNRDQDSAATDSIMAAHLDNIMRMADEGKLVIAGPFLDDTDIKGIYIFNVETIDEAKALTETDAAIQSGRLIMELHPWYGSAALPLLNNLHHRIEKKSVAD